MITIIGFFLTLLVWILLLPVASIVIVFFWGLIGFFTWDDPILVVLFVALLAAAYVMAKVTYHDIQVREQEGKDDLRIIGGSVKDTLLQYCKTVFMPVIPHISFLEQQRNIASRTTPRRDEV